MTLHLEGVVFQGTGFNRSAEDVVCLSVSSQARTRWRQSLFIEDEKSALLGTRLASRLAKEVGALHFFESHVAHAAILYTAATSV